MVYQDANPLNFKKKRPESPRWPPWPGSEGSNYTNYLLLGPAKFGGIDPGRGLVNGWMLKYQQHEIFTVIFFLVHTVFLFGWILCELFKDTVSVHGWQSRVAQVFKYLEEKFLLMFINLTSLNISQNQLSTCTKSKGYTILNCSYGKRKRPSKGILAMGI